MKHPVQDSPDPGIQTGSSEKQDGVVAGIPVSEVVWRGLEAVRLSGLTNMLDRPMVASLAEEMGFFESARWVREHRREFAHGIFQGFQVIRQPDNV